MTTRTPIEIEGLIYDALEEGWGSEDIIVMYDLRPATVQAVIADLNDNGAIAEMFAPLLDEPKIKDEKLCRYCGEYAPNGEVCIAHLWTMRKDYDGRLD